VNRLETFNEASILVMCWVCFSFTDFNPEPDIKFKCGWIFLIVVGIAVLINMAVMGKGVIMKLYRKCKYKRRKKQPVAV
jgi:hypothetical protein